MKPLNNDTIRKINSLQLFAETHDQGFVNEPLAGNWTWLELAIFENRLATLPREKEGVKLIWTSHLNRLGEAEYGWVRDLLVRGKRYSHRYHRTKVRSLGLMMICCACLR